VTGELGLQNFQGASPANLKKASQDRSSTSPERSLGCFESAGNSTSILDYWVPANVKAPRALFKHPRSITPAPCIPTSCSFFSSNTVYSLANLGVWNPITIGSNCPLGRAKARPLTKRYGIIVVRPPFFGPNLAVLICVLRCP
jgi:hypothetical protein